MMYYYVILEYIDRLYIFFVYTPDAYYWIYYGCTPNVSLCNLVHSDYLWNPYIRILHSRQYHISMYSVCILIVLRYNPFYSYSSSCSPDRLMTYIYSHTNLFSVKCYSYINVLQLRSLEIQIKGLLTPHLNKFFNANSPEREFLM